MLRQKTGDLDAQMFTPFGEEGGVEADVDERRLSRLSVPYRPTWLKPVVSIIEIGFPSCEIFGSWKVVALELEQFDLCADEMA